MPITAKSIDNARNIAKNLHAIVTDPNTVDETSSRAFNIRNVGSLAAGGTASFAARDAIESGKLFKFDRSIRSHRYGRHMAGVAAALIAGGVAYRMLAPKPQRLALESSDCSQLQKHAAIVPAIKAGAKALWKSPVHRKVMSSIAADAAVGAAAGAVFSENGDRLKGALSGATFGAGFGAMTGMGSRMGQLKHGVMPNPRTGWFKRTRGAFGRLKQTVKDLHHEGIGAINQAKVASHIVTASELVKFAGIGSMVMKGAKAAWNASKSLKGTSLGGVVNGAKWGGLFDGTLSALSAQEGESRIGAFAKGFGRGAAFGGATSYAHRIAKGVGGGKSISDAFKSTNKVIAGAANRAKNVATTTFQGGDLTNFRMFKPPQPPIVPINPS